MLLGVETNDEGRNVDDLLSNTDVTLADKDTGVVDGLGKSELVNLGLYGKGEVSKRQEASGRKSVLGMYLETTFQEILDTESQDVIELHAGVVQDTNTDQTANQGVTLEKTLGVLLVKSQKLTGSTTIRYPSATKILQTYNTPLP